MPSRRRKREIDSFEETGEGHLDDVLTRSHRERGRNRVRDTYRDVFDVRDITLRFGGVVSLRNVSMHMNRGEILAVIGPNGAVRRRSSTP